MAVVGTRQHLDTTIENLARELQGWEFKVRSLKRGLVDWDAAALEGIGYSAAEATKVLDISYAMTRIVEIINGSPEPTGQVFVDGIYPILGID